MPPLGPASSRQLSWFLLLSGYRSGGETLPLGLSEDLLGTSVPSLERDSQLLSFMLAGRGLVDLVSTRAFRVSPYDGLSFYGGLSFNLSISEET